jgi:magnesium-transporting ATPase (P-type)
VVLFISAVAKEASDIVILDDNFSSIVKAVLWGRSVFDNIRKFLQFQLTVNVVALTITLVSALTGYEPPLNAVMMLWVNLIMDTMGALALGTEPPSPTLLARKPYARDASIVSPVMWSHVAVQSLFQIAVLAYMLVLGWEDFGVVEGSTKHNTIIFTIFVFCQVFNEFNARSIGYSLNVFAGLHKNIIFLAIIAFTCVTQYVIVQFGADFVKVAPLTGHEWIRCIIIASITLPLGGIMRFTLISESRSSFVETGTVVSKRASKFVQPEATPFSFLVWFVVVTLIPVIVWSEFGQMWAPRFMVLAKRFA